MNEQDLKKIIASDEHHLLREASESPEEYETIRKKYGLEAVKTYLIDCMGYSEGDCDDMTYQEMLWIINDTGNLYDFQKFTS